MIDSDTIWLFTLIMLAVFVSILMIVIFDLIMQIIKKRDDFISVIAAYLYQCDSHAG